MYRTSLIALLVTVSTCLAAQPRYEDARGDFALTLPEAFVEMRQEARIPDSLCQFYMPNSDGTCVFVSLSRMDKEVNSHLTEPQVESGAAGLADVVEASLSKARWQDLDVDVVKYTYSGDGGSRLSYVAQIPIRHGAVKLAVAGPVEQDQQAQKCLQLCLAGLTGKSNLGRKSPLAALAAIALMIVVGAIAWGVARYKLLPMTEKPGGSAGSGRGALLGIFLAGSLLIASVSFADEARSYIYDLAGLAVWICGVIYIIRNRRARRQAADNEANE